MMASAGTTNGVNAATTANPRKVRGIDIARRANALMARTFAYAAAGRDLRAPTSRAKLGLMKNHPISGWVLLLALLAAGCAPMVGAGSGGLMVLLATVLTLAIGVPAAIAQPPKDTANKRAEGPPPPPPQCSGTWHSQCVDGRVKRSCCPQGAKCNYRYAPHVDCGFGRCVTGHDVGMCPSPEPQTLPSVKNETTCQNKGGSWESACVQGINKKACIVPVPTNYMGPPRNPKFFGCSDSRCTTGPVRAACYPTREEAKQRRKDCKTGWKKTCVQGQIKERCLPNPPTNYNGNFFKSTEYVDCGENRCVLGTEKWRCGR